MKEGLCNMFNNTNEKEECTGFSWLPFFLMLGKLL